MAPLHNCTVQRARAILSRTHIFIHTLAIFALFYYRFSTFITTPSLGLSWTLVTVAELVLTFVWAMSQAFRWRPVTREVHGLETMQPEKLPRVDVFICTADPKKEPVLEVMNTVISAMALDYPPDKLAVYLSDDGGSPLTKEAISEAYEVAKVWLPFCNKYGVKTRCPEAFFSAFCDGERLSWSDEYNAEELVVKSKYEEFKRRVEKGSEDGSKCTVVHDRAPCVEIIHGNGKTEENEMKMPLLVYVSREQRPSRPHRFKAGALNALLRISGLLSNGPYVMVLDCDMYCNDPTSARQAMCFLLDPEIAPSLAFVQYPQIFYNTSKNDIYDGQARSAFKTKWQGMDGIRGPLLTGTGYYLKRKALYGRPQAEDELLAEAEKAFGSSSKFIASLNDNFQRDVSLRDWSEEEMLQEVRNLATCTYESNTKWGGEVGYSYDCLLESSYTGYLLHCKGWISVYLYPKRPCFLGCTTIDMKDAMVQLMKWSSAWLGIGISNFSPLTYAMSRMPLLQTLCYGYFSFASFPGIFCLIYGVVLPVCLLKGVPLFPKVSDPWIGVFVFVFVSSLLQHLHEVLTSEESFKTWWNELRIWIIKSVTASLFGILDFITKKIGVHKVSFHLTNKVVDKEKLDKYEKGKFDFQGAAMFMVPLVILVLLNLVSCTGGLVRVIMYKNYDEMFVQVFLSCFLVVLSYPVLEGIATKARKGHP